MTVKYKLLGDKRNQASVWSKLYGHHNIISRLNDSYLEILPNDNKKSLLAHSCYLNNSKSLCKLHVINDVLKFDKNEVEKNESLKIMRESLDYVFGDSGYHINMSQGTVSIKQQLDLSHSPYIVNLLQEVLASLELDFISTPRAYPSNDIADLPLEQLGLWDKFRIPVLLISFALLMNAAHMMGYFHCLHAPLSHMLICGFACTFVLLYSGGRYIKDTLQDVYSLWPMYLCIASGIYLGLYPVFNLLPYILYRHICTDLNKKGFGRVADVLLVVLAYALQLTSQTYMLLPVGIIAAIYCNKPSSKGAVARSIGMTLFLTGVLSWLSIFTPITMHAHGIHVFFHDAILLLGVFEFSKAIRIWVRKQAIRLNQVLSAVTVHRNNKWVKLPLSRLLSGDSLYIKSGGRLPCSGTVSKSESQQYSEPSCETTSTFEFNETLLNADATLHSDAIVQVNSTSDSRTIKQKSVGDDVLETFNRLLSFYIVFVGLSLSLRYPALVLPVASSLFFGACPCVFTISRPMIDVMFHYFVTKAKFYVQKLPSSWTKPESVYFDRTNTIAFPVNGFDNFQVSEIAKKVISWLLAQGCAVGVLTRQDDQARLSDMSEQLDSRVEVTGMLTADGKNEFIDAANSSRVTMMLGDGENDIKALSNACHSLSHVKNTHVMEVANTSCDLQNQDYLGYVKFLFATCDLMTQLKHMALWYNVIILAVVGLYPVFTGAILIHPSTCCMLMTLGSVLQVSCAYLGMVSNANLLNVEQESLPIFKSDPVFGRLVDSCSNFMNKWQHSFRSPS